MRAFLLTLLFLLLPLPLAAQTDPSGGAALPLTQTVQTPDGRYAIRAPENWSAQMAASNSVYDWLVVLAAPNTDVQIAVLIVSPAQLSNAAVYPTTDFRTLAQSLLGTLDAGTDVLSFDSVQYGSHAAYEALLSDTSGDSFGVALNYQTYLGAVIVSTAPGQRDRWVRTGRAIAESISIRGVVESALPTVEAPPLESGSLRAFPPTSPVVQFSYPADWYVLITPDDQLGPYDAWIDLYNGRAALQNLPNAQTGLTAYDSGEFSLRILVQTVDSTSWGTVDYLNDQLHSLAAEVYRMGTVETFTAGNHDAAHVTVGTDVRDGSFTVVQLAPGQFVLLSASCALGELAQYTNLINAVAASLSTP
ncbi:MAG: hypothetical protein U0670_07655 [Anaerolineae bacterium]